MGTAHQYVSLPEAWRSSPVPRQSGRRAGSREAACHGRCGAAGSGNGSRASLAPPSALTRCPVGDGGLMMSAVRLRSAVRDQADLLRRGERRLVWR
jgi:hypothetical protein